MPGAKQIHLEWSLSETVLDNLQKGSPNVKAVSGALDLAFKDKLVVLLDKTQYPILSGLVGKFGPVNWSAQAKTTLKQWVAKEATRLLAKKSAETRKEAQKELGKFSDSTTLGALMGLSQPIATHPLFRQAAVLAQTATLAATTPGLSKDLAGQFASLYTANTTALSAFWTQLGENAKLKSFVPQLQLTLRLGSLTQNNIPLVQALQSYKVKGKVIASLRDLVRLTSADWTQLLAKPVQGKTIPIPDGIAGSTPQEKTSNYVNALMASLKASYPTAVLGGVLGTQPDIDPTLVRSVLSKNPSLDPSAPLPVSLDLSSYSAADQAKIISSFAALRQEINMFSSLDYKSAVGIGTSGTPAAVFQNPLRGDVASFLAASSDFDLQTTNIDAYLKANPGALKGLSSSATAITAQLKAVQRVYRVTTDAPDLSALMGEGFDSARSIGAYSKGIFTRKYSGLLGGAGKAAAVYGQAQSINSQVLNIIMNGKGALGGWNPSVIGSFGPQVQTLLEQNIPNWTELFGTASSCECGECMAVDGPAAYFVDLLQFLAGSMDNSAGRTPLDILIGNQVVRPTLPGRRPDLAFLKLNCENTNTTLPYVDLVNEILESFIYFVGLKNQSMPQASNNTPQDATADELAVNPEYTIQDVYDKTGPLATAYYPMGLPFDRWLMTVRLYLKSINSSREEVMNACGQFDLAAGADKQAAEILGMNEYEYFLVTGTSWSGTAFTTPDAAQWYGYPSPPANPNPPAWEADIVQVPEFLKRTGVSFDNLVALLETQFLNPGQTIQLYTPETTPDPANPSQTISVAPCDISLTVIQPFRAQTYLDMPFFLRLLGKLGWQITELDKALQALEVSGTGGAQSLSRRGMVLALAEMKRLQSSLNLPVDQLVSLFRFQIGGSEKILIDIDGRNSLYNRLFQNKSVINPVDPAFQLAYSASLTGFPASLTWPIAHWPDGSVQNQLSCNQAKTILLFTGAMTEDQRDYLLDTWNSTGDSGISLAVQNLYDQRWCTGTDLASSAVPISDHVNTLLAAFQITAADLEAIGQDAGIDVSGGTSDLNLSNLSIFYRYATLAQALRIPVGDMVSLKTLTGIDPFTLGSGDPVTHPMTGFIQTAQTVLASKFSVAQLNYIYRAIDDTANGLGILQSDEDLFAVDLLTGLQKIAATNAFTPDPTGSALRKKLATLLSPDQVDPVMGFIGGTALYTSPLPALPSGVILPPGQVTYDGTGHLLLCRGPMTDATNAQLLALPGVDQNFISAINDLYHQPRTILKQDLSFLDQTQALAELINDSPLPAPADRYNYVFQSLLAHLQDMQNRSLVKQSLSQTLGFDSSLTALLLEGPPDASAPALLVSQGDPTQPAIADFLGGLNASYYSDTGLTNLSATRIDPGVNLDGTEAVFGSVRWTGDLAPTDTDNYFFSLSPAGGEAQLWVDGVLVLDTMNSPNVNNPVNLTVGQLYDFKLEYRNASSSQPSLQLQWAGSGGTASPSGVPFAAFAPQSLYLSLASLYRIAALVKGFGMTADEVSYLSAHGVDFAGFNLASLPKDGTASPQTDGAAPSFFSQWQRLNALYALKASLPVGNTDLFGIFQEALQSPSPADVQPPVSQAVQEAVLAATGWSPADFDALAGAGGFNLEDTDFRNEIRLVELASCLSLGKRLGVSTAQLWTWANNMPDSDQAQDVINTVKAKYGDTQWLTIGKSLNDKIRDCSRNALTAYILHMPVIAGQGITDADGLYEYFLIDVQMGTCMLTSRLVQATAGVQLFVQRCLMNLENGNMAHPEWNVAPAQIDAAQWEWMQNYRVWQANREVFLFPENWIDPTLRDDQTPFFKELQNELLQADVTADNVETAYRHYLEKLDEVSQLEIAGLTVEQDENGDTHSHVFGRTAANPHIYYYRCLNQTWDDAGKQWVNTWSPWESVNVDIQGDHLIPTTWNNRLFLFWPIFTESSDTTAAPPANDTDASAPSKTLQIQMAWSEYKNGKWSKKQITPIVRALMPYLTDKLKYEQDLEWWGWGNVMDAVPGNQAIWSTQYSWELDTTEFFFMVSTGESVELKVDVYWIPNVTSGEVTTSFGNAWHLGSFSFQGGLMASPSVDFSSQTMTISEDEGDSTFQQTISAPSWQELFLPFNESAFLGAGNGGSLSQGWASSNMAIKVCNPIGSNVNPLSFDGYNKKLKTVPFNTWYLTFDQGLTDGPYSYLQYHPEGESCFLFFQDYRRTYMVIWNGSVWFQQAYHPHSVDFISLLNESGIDALLSLESQQLSDMQIHAYDIYAANRDLYVRQGWLGYDCMAFWLFSPDSPTPSGAVPVFLLSKIIQVGTGLVPMDSIFTTDQAWAHGNGPSGYGFSGSGIAGYAYPDSSNATDATPLYALVNPTTGNHFYTISIGQRDLAMNWYGYELDPDTSGGVVCYVFNGQSSEAVSGQAIPVYQLSGSDFQQIYSPDPNNVALPYPKADVDFNSDGAYSIYNWELFFHIPFLIATRLSANQQFEDSQKWFHYIFNPTNNSGGPAPNRFWNFLPFNESTVPETLGELLQNPNDPSLLAQIQQYETNPFDPDAIARLRPAAYQKAVVMKYLDNLIAWGDSLFGQNTRESIGEATQLYVLAQQILGPKPVLVPSHEVMRDQTYNDLRQDGIDDFSNAMVSVENLFPFSSGSGGTEDNGAGVNNSVPGPYFCIPPDTDLLAYWDKVADRLYKIRHCMNLQGQVEQLALFAPPINPALLVAAQAQGVDLASALNDLTASVGNYRFTYLFSKAMELCAEVRGLGATLLSALEKKDAEALALLRAAQETAVLQAVLQVKQNQLNEANSNLQGLQDSLAVAVYRQTYYQGLITGGLSGREQGQVQNLTQAQSNKQSSQTAGLLGTELSLIPQMELGASGISSPVVTATFGGQQLSTVASMVAQAFNMNADFYSFIASMAGLMGGWDRRGQEWAFQAQSAALEIKQINDQIAAANFRVQIAQQDLDNQSLLISNAQDVQSFLTGKFTNEDLYSWMVGQISAVYFQCYQLAYGLAKKAEACFRFELGLADSNYIQFGYWDSLKQGLLSGEKLYLDLKRLEGSYLDQNQREYEITKPVSLVLLDPLALITLKETGQCLINLPEAYFDMDYPGQYMRRLRNVSLTIPCVIGPYTTINCTLTLQTSKIRWNPAVSSQYLESPSGSDARFFYNLSATQSIATSTAQNDSGLFEVNFRDERYLPFEGAGAVSQWMLSMPKDCNAFDFETITDVILNLRYTARDGGGVLGAAAKQAATLPGPQGQSGLVAPTGSYPGKQDNLTRLFSIKHEFPTEWYQFLNPANPANGQILSIALSPQRFPFQYRGKVLTVTQMEFFMRLKDEYPADIVNPGPTNPEADYDNSLTYTLTPGTTSNPAPTFVSDSNFLNGILYANCVGSSVKVTGATLWTLALPASSGSPATSTPPTIQPVSSPWLYKAVAVQSMSYYLLNPELVVDIYLVCHYSAG